MRLSALCGSGAVLQFDELFYKSDVRMTKYVQPTLDLGSFTCPSCGTFAQQMWAYQVGFRWGSVQAGWELIPFQRCLCNACKAVSLWSTKEANQIYPRSIGAPMPHPDLPDDAKNDYLEARSVASDSPRAAAALLRLGVQKLLPKLGGKGKNIDDDIAALVGKGLSPHIRDALDICRVVGNNAVHPGELNVDDDPALVSQLFDLINFIVAQTIERDKAMASMMAKLPQGAKDAIARRDAKAIAAASPAPPSEP